MTVGKVEEEDREVLSAQLGRFFSGFMPEVPSLDPRSHGWLSGSF